LTDAAKDVMEFLHRVRWNGQKAGVARELTERATQTFLEEYASHHPNNLANLEYYWSYAVLFTLLRLLHKRRDDDDEALTSWQERVDFLQEEFRNVPRYVSTYRGAW
jgi:hypothetical protein